MDNLGNKGVRLSAQVDEKPECNLVVDDAADEKKGSHTSDEDAADQGDPQPPGPTATAKPAFATLGLPSRYQVVELLGEGGMAHVYKALDSEDGGKPVAIKILRPEIVPDPTIVQRFFREAKAAQKLSHPCNVSVSAYGTTDNKMPYLIMEYIQGRNLAQIISEEGHLADGRALKIFMQIAEGLKDAHRLGIVHRDLKPSNILIATNDDGTESVKIADFGIAKPASSERWIDPDLTKTGAILGSPAYMSPEQCLGHVVDERSDIYSLGCLMYETLCGRSPFASETPVKSMIRHLEESPEPFEIEHSQLHIATGLEQTIMKCLHKQPAKRFQTVTQLQDALIRSLDPGLARRFCSDAIDAAVLIFFCTITVILSKAMPNLFGLHFLHDLVAFVLPFILCVVIAVGWSLFQYANPTPGKRLTGLKVIDSNGSVIPFVSFAMATIVMIISLLVGHVAVVVNTLASAFGPHPWFIYYGCGLGLFTLIAFLNFAYAWHNNGRSSTLDKFTGRTVVRADQVESTAFTEWRSIKRLFAVAVVLLLSATVILHFCLLHQF